ncbi:MAG: transposase [Acidobacteriota bacterium]
MTPLTATTPGSAKPCQTSGLDRGLEYVVGIQPTLSVWPPGKEPLPPKPRKSMGRPPKLRQRAPNHQPVLAKDLAAALAPKDWPSALARNAPPCSPKDHPSGPDSPISAPSEVSWRAAAPRE